MKNEKLELKTLEDLSVTDGQDNSPCNYRTEGCNIDVKDLRELAIKWLNTENDKMSGMTGKWIRHFFNITDEDMK